MKKLSLLVALMLCVTIGGVYATWGYAGNTDIIDQAVESKITIANTEIKTANGVYTISSNLVLTVDQANDAHEARLDFGSNNSDPAELVVTFTPQSHAPANIKQNGVVTNLIFDVTTPMEYKMDGNGNYDENGTATPILTLTNENDITWQKDESGTLPVFTYKMDKAALEQHIQLSQTFVLDLKSEHDAFGTALAGNVKITVTDGTIN